LVSSFFIDAKTEADDEVDAEELEGVEIAEVMEVEGGIKVGVEMVVVRLVWVRRFTAGVLILVEDSLELVGLAGVAEALETEEVEVLETEEEDDGVLFTVLFVVLEVAIKGGGLKENPEEIDVDSVVESSTEVSVEGVVEDGKGRVSPRRKSRVRASLLFWCSAMEAMLLNCFA
jgi:hypothetical protein